MRIALEFQADLKVGTPEGTEQGGSPKVDGSHQATEEVEVEEMACPLHDPGLDPVPPAFQLLQHQPPTPLGSCACQGSNQKSCLWVHLLSTCHLYV